MRLRCFNALGVALFVAIAGLTTGSASAQDSRAIPPSLVTPDRVETQLGTLEFRDGAPSKATAEKLYDHIDFTHAYNAYVNAMSGVSIRALDLGLQGAGVKHNEVIIFEQLMDASSLFLTANADTIYVIGILDLTQGPMVIEVPPDFLGAIDDYWFRWVTDLGLPGGDRGMGGKYLVLPPGYEGQLPDGGYFVARSRTTRVAWFGRMFLANQNDPKPVVATIKKYTKVYPYDPAGYGTTLAEFLAGNARFGALKAPAPTVFHNGSGKVMNTVPPTDVSFFDRLNEVVQQEPPDSLDIELMGSMAAIGIKHGQPFAPDARMKKILAEAAAVGNAASRTLFMSQPRDPSWYYYGEQSNWWNMMFQTGAGFETPIPMITREGVKPFPPTGYRQLDGRTAFFYGITGITPAMAMRLPGIGSAYIFAYVDADKNFLDGAKTYRVTLPKGIPAEKFWSLTVYDNMTRSMLATPQRYPRAGSQAYPSPAAEPNADGSTTIWFAPQHPAGVKRGNWIQTDPKKGWFTYLRLYSPLESFFTKAWRPSEIELVK
jgi:hypothetical protein